MSAPARRRASRSRVLALAAFAALVVLTVAAFHAFLAQTQVRLERLRARTDAAEARYEAERLENGRLSSPARITQRATELGLVPPAVAPIAVPVPGDVPKRGAASQTLADWVEVKPNLTAAP